MITKGRKERRKEGRWLENMEKEKKKKKREMESSDTHLSFTQKEADISIYPLYDAHKGWF